jgi:2-hydroxy-6-oxonona-2,4-dienedioate hydrolase
MPHANGGADRLTERRLYRFQVVELTGTQMTITEGSGSGSAARRRLVSEYVRVDGDTVHARVSNTAARPGCIPVVLVHGLVVSSRYMEPLAETLAPDTRLYAPDLPGFGKSRSKGGATDVPSLAAALDRWMDVVGLQETIVVANSFGCQISAHLAASYPKRVRKLVLLGPVVDPRACNLLKLAVYGLANVPLEPPSLGAIIARDLWAMGLPRALALLQAMLSNRIELTLPSIDVPTYIVRGERDPLVSQRWADALTSLLPFGTATVIPNAGHALNYNSADRVATLVRSIMRGSQGLARAS